MRLSSIALHRRFRFAFMTLTRPILFSCEQLRHVSVTRGYRIVIAARPCLRICRAAIVAVLVLHSQAYAADYYVDCSLLTAGVGTADAPWNNPVTLSTHTFMPGDVVAFKRGTTCAGMVAPRGSGEPGAPITIAAYGSGARPVIVATGWRAAVALFNQSHWVIRDLETRGGNPHGIHISGDAAATLSDFRISNVSVHDVEGVATTKQSGLIEISPAHGSATVLDDVVIDGATVFNTEQWKGIHVGCANGIFPARNPGRIIIRNSRASNIAGDGITIYACSNGLIENNVSYDIGTAATDTVGTPNAIWTWACADCIVQFNEGFRSHSPARDGGIFDVDWGSSRTTVQYNYGHDADGYCVAIFGAWGLITTNSIVRYNICANNGRSDPYQQGDIYLKTWDGGSLDGVEIYNNTIYWNPAAPSPALMNRENLLVGAGSHFFKNNIIVSSSGAFVSTDDNLTLDHNLYWARDDAPVWEYRSGSWDSFTSFQSSALQEAHGLYADPLLNNSGGLLDRPLTVFTLRPDSPAIDRGATIGAMTGRDFFGVVTPQGTAVDIGASEHEAVMNLIVNPGFELDLATTQTPYGWSTWSRAGQDYADYTQAYADGDPRSYYGAHGVLHSYDVFTYQVVTGLPTGNYQLTAWVKSSGGQSVAWMEVNAYGGAKRTVAIPATSTWTMVTLPDVAVTAGEARVGFYSIAEAGQWLAFDDVSFTPAVLTPPVPPPTNWTFCATEGGVCAFTGTTEVRYGANGSFFSKTLTNGTACSNAVFGDPAPGTPKQCAIGARSTPPPMEWTFCAPENGVCAFSGTIDVRYGANGSFFVKTLTDGTACTNQVFGDPAPDVAKSCSLARTGP